MKIKTDKRLVHVPKGGGASYLLTPEMGAISHFPRRIAEAFIAMGAQDVTKRPKPKTTSTDTTDSADAPQE